MAENKCTRALTASECENDKFVSWQKKMHMIHDVAVKIILYVLK